MRYLILSAGALYATAHLGVLKYLEEQNKKPDHIIGVSGGSLIGSLYAAGKPLQECIKLVTNIKIWDVFDPSLWPFNQNGIMKGRKLQQWLKKQIGGKKLNQMAIPFSVLITNVVNGEPLMYTKDSELLVSEVVGASCAIPGVFATQKVGDIEALDGGVQSYIPVQLFSFDPEDEVIVSNVSFLRGERHIKNILDSILISYEELMNARVRDAKKFFRLLKVQKKTWIDIPCEGNNLLEFNKIPEWITLGYKTIKEAGI